MPSKSFFVCTIFSLFVSNAFCASTNLDQQMSLQDKQLTGVVNLTLKQKQALAAWIDKNYVPLGQAQQAQECPSSAMDTPQAPSSSMKPSDLTLSINAQNGQQLILSDSTRWQIHPQDVNIASLWLTPSHISIKPGTDPAYPYILTNLTTNQSIRAKQIAPAPAQAPTTPNPMSSK
jgi:hypothetical protein